MFQHTEKSPSSQILYIDNEEVQNDLARKLRKRQVLSTPFTVTKLVDVRDDNKLQLYTKTLNLWNV